MPLTGKKALEQYDSIFVATLGSHSSFVRFLFVLGMAKFYGPWMSPDYPSRTFLDDTLTDSQ
ncbi:hypothetical protein BJX99DRAFT_239827 [Aspergillus californicus]